MLHRNRKPGRGTTTPVVVLVLLVMAPASSRAQPARPVRTPAPVTRPSSPAPRARVRARAVPPAPGKKKALRPPTATPRAAGARPTEPLRPTPAPIPARPADPYTGLDHTGTPSLPPRTDRLPPERGAQGKKRRVPSYRGARKPRPTAGEVLIWIPRVIFFPVHITLEYLIRWPLVKLITVLEKHHVLETVGDFFKFDEGRANWLPTFLKEFGKFNQVGLYYSHRDVGLRGHTVSLQAAFWVNNWYHARFTDQWKIFRRDQGSFTTRVEFQWRPDQTYYGLGPETTKDAKSFYRLRQTDVDLSLAATLVGLNRFSANLQFRNTYISDPTSDLGDGDRVSIADPSREIYWGSSASEIPGYEDEYNLLTLRLRLDLDSRKPERVDTPGSGVRLELRGAFNIDPSQTRLHYVRWEGELAGFLDVTGRNHVLSMRLYVAGLEQTGPASIPFHERLKLGGKEYLRGYVGGRFRGDSAVVASAQYRYPVWWMLDAYLFLSAGNAFGNHFHDFAFRKLVMSWGIGMRTNNSKNVSFDVLVAFGSNPFGLWKEGFELDDVRLVIGLNQGF